MILIACPGCGRRKKREPATVRPSLPKRCTNCGAAAGKVFRHIKIWMLTDYDGDDPDKARQQTFSGLLYLAKGSRYKPDWAFIKYNRLYGEWPNGLSEELAPPRQELVAWSITEKAQYAQAMRKLEKEHENGRNSNFSGFDLSDAAEHTGQNAQDSDGERGAM